MSFQSVNIPIQTPPELGYGASFAQDLGISPMSLQAKPDGSTTNGIYLLQVTTQNSLQHYPGLLEVEIDFGLQKLCDFYVWGKESLSQITVVCVSPYYLVGDNSLPGGGPAQGQHNLVVTWTVNDGSFNGGWPLKFYNASLMFTPTN